MGKRGRTPLVTNIIDCIENNFFLKKVFPEGINEVLVGQFGLDQGRFCLTLHARVKPAKETPKWGVWGEDYNVIAFEMLGSGISGIEIKNWSEFGFATVNCFKCKNDLTIELVDGDWSFKLSCAILVFQKSCAYLS